MYIHTNIHIYIHTYNMWCIHILLEIIQYTPYKCLLKNANFSIKTTNN